MLSKNIGAVAILFLLVVCLSGCGNTYTYNNKTYHSPDVALNAHANHIESIKEELLSASSPLYDSAIIITPSLKTCEALGITRTGHAGDKLINYVGKYLESDYAFFSQYLEKSNLFKVVDHEIVDFPRQRARKVSNNYAATVYLDMISPSQISWKIITSSDSKPAQINFDATKSVGAPKIQSWIDDIQSKMEGAKK